MVRCNQYNFSTYGGDGKLSISFEPVNRKVDECNLDLDLDGSDEDNLKAVGFAYFNLTVDALGHFHGTLTGDAEDKYDYLCRVRILTKLKESKDRDYRGEQFKFNAVTPGFFDISYSTRYDNTVQDLLADSSLEETLSLRRMGSNYRGLYITRRGELRVKQGSYDLNHATNQASFAPSIGDTQNNISGTQNNVSGDQYNIQARHGRPTLSRHARELLCLIAKPLMEGSRSFAIMRGSDKMSFRYRGGTGNFEMESDYEAKLSELVQAGYIIAPTDLSMNGGLTGDGEDLYEQICSQHPDR